MGLLIGQVDFYAVKSYAFFINCTDLLNWLMLYDSLISLTPQAIT